MWLRHRSTSAQAAFGEFPFEGTRDDEIRGYVHGFIDAYLGLPYAGTPCTPHRLTVCVPKDGPSAYATGYRDGWFAGCAARFSVN